jgi:osmotically-inducible protein OsmY
LQGVDCGLVVMLSEAKKYHGYARECVRLAGQVETPAQRDKLIELARVWMDAAPTEEEAQERAIRPSSLSSP